MTAAPSGEQAADNSSDVSLTTRGVKASGSGSGDWPTAAPGSGQSTSGSGAPEFSADPCSPSQVHPGFQPVPKPQLPMGQAAVQAAAVPEHTPVEAATAGRDGCPEATAAAADLPPRTTLTSGSRQLHPSFPLPPFPRYLGPEQVQRRSTDRVWLPAITPLLALVSMYTIYAAVKGRPEEIRHAWNARQELCGLDSGVRTQPLVYWSDTNRTEASAMCMPFCPVQGTRMCFRHGQRAVALLLPQPRRDNATAAAQLGGAERSHPLVAHGEVEFTERCLQSGVLAANTTLEMAFDTSPIFRYCMPTQQSRETIPAAQSAWDDLLPKVDQPEVVFSVLVSDAWQSLSVIIGSLGFALVLAYFYICVLWWRPMLNLVLSLFTNIFITGWLGISFAFTGEAVASKPVGNLHLHKSLTGVNVVMTIVEILGFIVLVGMSGLVLQLLVNRRRFRMAAKLVLLNCRALSESRCMLLLPASLMSCLCLLATFSLWVGVALYAAQRTITSNDVGGQARLTILQATMEMAHVIASILIAIMLVFFSRLVTAHVIGTWYWNRKDMKLHGFLYQFRLAVQQIACYHLGTIIKAALLLPLLLVVQSMYRINPRISSSHSSWTDKPMLFTSGTGFSQVALHGFGLAEGGWRAAHLLKRHATRIAGWVQNSRLLMTPGKASVIGSAVLISLYAFQVFTLDVYSTIGPVRLVLVISIGFGLALYSCYEQAIDTLVQCVCEDMERNNGTTAHPYHMPKGMRGILEDDVQEIAMDRMHEFISDEVSDDEADDAPLPPGFGVAMTLPAPGMAPTTGSKERLLLGESEYRHRSSEAAEALEGGRWGGGQLPAFGLAGKEAAASQLQRVPSDGVKIACGWNLPAGSDGLRAEATERSDAADTEAGEELRLRRSSELRLSSNEEVDDRQAEGRPGHRGFARERTYSLRHYCDAAPSRRSVESLRRKPRARESSGGGRRRDGASRSSEGVEFRTIPDLSGEPQPPPAAAETISEGAGQSEGTAQAWTAPSGSAAWWADPLLEDAVVARLGASDVELQPQEASQSAAVPHGEPLCGRRLAKPDGVPVPQPPAGRPSNGSFKLGSRRRVAQVQRPQPTCDSLPSPSAAADTLSPPGSPTQPLMQQWASSTSVCDGSPPADATALDP